MVEAHALGHVAYVSPDTFTDFRDLVYEGYFCREECVARVLHHLRRLHVRVDDWLTQRLVQFADGSGGIWIVRTKHDTVRLKKVDHGCAFPEELRIRYDRWAKVLGLVEALECLAYADGARAFTY